MLQGQRVGYAHSATRERMVDGQKRVETDTTTLMKLTRFGQAISVKQVLHLDETADGKFLGFTSVMDNPPNSRISTVGVVNGDVLDLTTKSGGSDRKSTFAGINDLKSPAWADKYLSEKGLKVGESVAFDTYEPQMGKKTTITLKRVEDKDTKLWDGTTKTLQCVQMTQTILPGVKTELYLNEELNTLKTVIPLMRMETYEVSEEEALKAPEGELDFAVDTLVKVDDIGTPHKEKKITYHIQVDGADLEGLFVDDDSQDVKIIDEDELDLTVTSLDPLMDQPNTATASLDIEYLKSSLFLECKAPAIQKLAEQGDADKSTPGEIAVALESFVKEIVTEKNFSTSMATALEVANTRAGDCSEHAVLLAALLRAKEIPSRVAVGFVHSKELSAFVGHMWTEAYLNGNWVPLDATLAKGGIGAGHIKVATSSLSEEGMVPAAEFVPLMHLLGRTRISVKK